MQRIMMRSSMVSMLMAGMVFASGCPDDGGSDDDGGTSDADGGQDSGMVVDTDSGMAEVDSGMEVDAGACGDVAGTYDMTWTADAANDDACPVPDAAIEILADGLDVGSPALTCSSGAECTADNCMRATLDASCAASMSVSGPCASLDAGRTLSITTSFSGAMLSATVSDTMTAVGPCAFTGEGVKG